MKHFYLTFCLLLTFSLAAAELTYTVDGNSEKKITLESLVKTVVPVSVKDYYKPAILKQELTGFNFVDLLNHLWGKKWRNYEGIEFQTKTKYTLTIPVKEFLKTKSFLAYKFAKSKLFVEMDKTSNMLVGLGPFYLVWEKKNSEVFNRYVYQIHKINLVKKMNSFRALAIKDKKMIQGRKYYVNYCFRCHSLNGEGSSLSIDLAKSNIVKSKGRAYIEKYILNPSKEKAFSQMPDFDAKVKDKKSVIKSIVDFIEFATKKDE